MNQGQPPQNPLNPIPQTDTNTVNNVSGLPVPIPPGGTIQPSQSTPQPLIQKPASQGGLPPLKEESENAEGKSQTKAVTAGGSGSRWFFLIVIFLVIILTSSLGFIGYSLYSNPKSSISIAVQDFFSGFGLDLGLGGGIDHNDTQSDDIENSTEAPDLNSELDPELMKFIDSFSRTSYEIESKGQFLFFGTADEPGSENGTALFTLDLDNSSTFFKEGVIVMNITDKGTLNEQKTVKKSDGIIYVLDDEKKEYFVGFDPAKSEESTFKSSFQMHPLLVLYLGLRGGNITVDKLENNEYKARLTFSTAEKENEFPVIFKLDSRSNISQMSMFDDSQTSNGLFTFNFKVLNDFDKISSIPEDYTEVSL